MSDEEEWRPVVGFDGLYEVSDQGRVRSLERVVMRRKVGIKPVRERILTETVRRDGRVVHVSLNKPPRRSHPYKVHRLVLEAFVGPCPAGMEGCHRDGNARNNRLDNLRWDTHSNNMRDAIRHGTALIGEKNPSAILSAAAAMEIRQLAASGEWTFTDIGKRYGVSRHTVMSIHRRDSWQHMEAA